MSAAFDRIVNSRAQQALCLPSRGGRGRVLGRKGLGAQRCHGTWVRHQYHHKNPSPQPGVPKQGRKLPPPLKNLNIPFMVARICPQSLVTRTPLDSWVHNQRLITVLCHRQRTRYFKASTRLDHRDVVTKETKVLTRGREVW